MSKPEMSDETSATPNEGAGPAVTPASAAADESKAEIELPGTDAPLLEASDLNPPKSNRTGAHRTMDSAAERRPMIGTLVPFLGLSQQSQPRARTLPLLATVAIAATIGAIAGAVSATGISQFTTPTVAAPAAPAPNPQAPAIAKMRTEIAAMKASIEASNRNAAGLFAKTSDRLDKIDHAQAEPAAKLAKVMETLDRLEKRADTPAPAKEITGSIQQPQPIAASAPPGSQMPNMPGWSVRGVYGGVALLQGRLGLIEVQAGDVVPGIGRIDSIRRQDGRWVVMTSRGVIVSAQR